MMEDSVASVAQDGQVAGQFIAAPLVCAVMYFEPVLSIANLTAMVRLLQLAPAYRLPFRRLEVQVIPHLGGVVPALGQYPDAYDCGAGGAVYMALDAH